MRVGTKLCGDVVNLFRTKPASLRHGNFSTLNYRANQFDKSINEFKLVVIYRLITKQE